jgi:tRNA threonylcarbamoyladenosine biosynthesis protein TsaE
VKTTELNSIAELKSFAEKLAKQLDKKQILSLEGPMGSGKTTFVQFLVQALGGAQTSSPTFSLHQRYKVQKGFVEHLDLYRIKSEQDLESSGFWDLFAEDSGIVIVEWGDRLAEWPPGWKLTRLKFDIKGPNSRTITQL